MTITTVSLNQGDNIDVAFTLPLTDVAAFALIDTKVSEDGNSRESVYQKISGNEEYPYFMRVGVYKNPKANNGIGSTNVSVKITNNVQKADVDSLIWVLPETWTLAKSAPGGSAFPDSDADVEMIGTLVSTYLNVASGVITTANIDELKFGITNRILEHANSAA